VVGSGRTYSTVCALHGELVPVPGGFYAHPVQRARLVRVSGCSGPAPARSEGGARRTGRGPRWHYPRVQSSGRYCRGWSTSPTLTKTMSHTQQLRTRTTSKPNLRCLSGALVGELGEMAGDDEVLPRHPDALEDPWTTTRASRSRDQGI
jgi:hypothetical protein